MSLSTRSMKPNLKENRANLLYLKNTMERLVRSRVSPRAAFLEAQALVTHYGRMNRLDFITGRRGLTPGAKKSIARAVSSRRGGKPLSYVLRKAEFLGHSFFVTPDTLIPRMETEVLAEEALRVMRSLDSLRSLGTTARQPRVRPLEILDIGTGCGCLAVGLTIARPDCRMTALDISREALEVARRNIRSHGLAGKIKLVQSDLFGAFGSEDKGRWDMIVSNPPYVREGEIPSLSREVRSEPRLALNGGRDGERVVRTLLEKAPYFLKKDGWLLVEIGDGQSKRLARWIAKRNDFRNLRFVKDMPGRDRVLVVGRG